MSVKDSFYALLRESVLVQASVTLILVGALVYLYITGAVVPDDLVSLTLLVVGFWFGSKSQAAVERTMKDYVSNR